MTPREFDEAQLALLLEALTPAQCAELADYLPMMQVQKEHKYALKDLVRKLSRKAGGVA